MAPRSRARAAQQAAPAARFFKITQLPEAVLAKCLGFLDLKQRCAPGPGRLLCARAVMCSALNPNRQAAVVARPFAAAAALAARDHLLSNCCNCCRLGPASLACKRFAAAACRLGPASLACKRFAAAACRLGPASLACKRFAAAACRLGPASLACKRFAAAACSPELLRQMDVGELPNLPAVRSLAAFLARHGRHLQRLIVCCEDGTGEGEAIAAGAVTACLMTAGAGGQMAELTAIGCIRSSDWLAAMPSLRRLHLEARPLETDLHVSPEISSLTALSSLALEGDSIIPAGTRLPASLECVTLQWDCSDSFPEQASGAVLASMSVSGFKMLQTHCPRPVCDSNLY